MADLLLVLYITPAPLSMKPELGHKPFTIKMKFSSKARCPHETRDEDGSLWSDRKSLD